MSTPDESDRLLGEQIAYYRAIAPEYEDHAISGPGEEDRVRFVQADLFTWTPDRRYDVVFFGSWISHVPLDRFDAFWSPVADCLRPAGRVFFADDAYRTPDELIEGESSSTIRRRLNDGTAYRAVKVPYSPADLEDRLRRLGWQVPVTATPGPCYWGEGGPARRRPPRPPCRPTP